MESRCGACRFWGSDPGDEKTKFRPCRAVIHDHESVSSSWRESDDNDDPEFRPATYDAVHKALAVVVDGSGYMATLRCREDFGCVLFEPSQPRNEGSGE
jgi:hypothetical protein